MNIFNQKLITSLSTRSRFNLLLFSICLIWGVASTIDSSAQEYELYSIVHGHLGNGTIEPSLITATPKGGEVLFDMHVDGHDEEYVFNWSFFDDLILFESMTFDGRPETIYPTLGAAKTNGISTSNEGRVTAGGTWENVNRKEIFGTFEEESGIPMGDISWISNTGERYERTDGSGSGPDELISISDAGAGKEFTAIRIDFEVAEADSSGTVDYQVIYVFRRTAPAGQPNRPLYRLHQIVAGINGYEPSPIGRPILIEGGVATSSGASCVIATWDSTNQRYVSHGSSVAFNFQHAEFFLGDDVYVDITFSEARNAPDVNVGKTDFSYNLKDYHGNRLLDDDVTPLNSRVATNRRMHVNAPLREYFGYSLTNPAENFLPLNDPNTPKYLILPVGFHFFTGYDTNWINPYQVLYVFKRTLTQKEIWLGRRIKSLVKTNKKLKKELKRSKTAAQKRRAFRKLKQASKKLNSYRRALRNFA